MDYHDRMAALASMPSLIFDTQRLLDFGKTWAANGGSLKRTPPFSSIQLGEFFDKTVANALAAMLGGIQVVKPSPTALIPAHPDCVELGPCRIVGGVRPQNFDVGYRPDGVRFAFDSKTLNDSKSVSKNYQNMINDLATEATTVHTRFPFAVVAFMVVIPEPCLAATQRDALIRTLERLGARQSPEQSPHLAEAIALVIWQPATGLITADIPSTESLLRIERFSQQVEAAYVSRYKGLPPHAKWARTEPTEE